MNLAKAKKQSKSNVILQELKNKIDKVDITKK